MLRAFLYSVVFLLSPAVAATPLLTMDFAGNLFEISPDSSTVTPMGAIQTPDDQYRVLSYSKSGYYYTFSRSSSNPDPVSVVTFDPRTLNVENRVLVDRPIGIAPRGLAVRSDGTLLIPSSGNTLYSLDPETGETSFFSNTGVSGFFEGLAFDDNDNLYAVGRPAGASRSAFYAVDTAQGSARALFNLPIDADTLTYAGDGVFYSVESGRGSRGFIVINVNTGLVARLRYYRDRVFTGLAIKDLTPPLSIEIVGSTTLECESDRQAIANLSASVVDSEADPVAYVDWQIEGDVVATSETLSTSLPLGTTLVTATATSSSGVTATASVDVAVVDTTEPEISVAFFDKRGNEVTQIVRNGLHQLRFSVSASDACEGPVVADASGGVALQDGDELAIHATQEDVILGATEFIVISAASDLSGNEAITKTSLNIID